MIFRNKPSETLLRQLRFCDRASGELEAAQILMKQLESGEETACIHLYRAIGLLASVRLVKEESGADGDKSASHATPPDFFDNPIWKLAEADEKKSQEAMRIILKYADAGAADAGRPVREERKLIQWFYNVLENLQHQARKRIYKLYSPPSSNDRLVVIIGFSIAAVAFFSWLIFHGFFKSKPFQPNNITAAASSAPKRSPVSAKKIALEKLSQPRAEGTCWDCSGNVIIPVEGLTVEIGKVSHADHLEVSLDNNDRYTLEFLDDGGIAIANTSIGPQPVAGGLGVYHSEIPAQAVDKGFTAIRIIGNGDGAYSVGHLILSGGKQAP